MYLYHANTVSLTVIVTNAVNACTPSLCVAVSLHQPRPSIAPLFPSRTVIEHDAISTHFGGPLEIRLHGMSNTSQSAKLSDIPFPGAIGLSCRALCARTASQWDVAGTKTKITSVAGFEMRGDGSFPDAG